MINRFSGFNICSYNVEIDGFKMLDGGISDSIPIHKFMEMGYEKNVVILTQHDGYRKKKNSMLPLIRLKLGKKYPNLVHDLEVRHIMYNKTLDDLKEQEVLCTGKSIHSNQWKQEVWSMEC